MKRVRVYYAGNVQGVGFRFAAVDAANRYGLVGWVRNTGDGGVELVAEGHEPALTSFLDDLNSALAQFIREKNISWEPAAGQFTGFQIKY